MAQTLEMPSYQHEDAWNVDWLRVDDVHELYYQQYGKKYGKPGEWEERILLGSFQCADDK